MLIFSTGAWIWIAPYITGFDVYSLLLLWPSAGISLVYPGSMGVMRMMLDQHLLEGRTKLILEYGGERFKLRTRDKNDIDTMYVNQATK